jgi:hypothetical protein
MERERGKAEGGKKIPRACTSSADKSITRETSTLGGRPQNKICVRVTGARAHPRAIVVTLIGTSSVVSVLARVHS